MEFSRDQRYSLGCNTLFIALIPKVPNPKFTSDYRHISLVVCQYKIIGKLLANQLLLVIDSVVSLEQSALIKGRQIFDRPLMLSEIIANYKVQKKAHDVGFIFCGLDLL